MAATASESEKQRESTIVVPTRARGGPANGREAQAARSSLRRIRGDYYILAQAMASRRTTRVLAQGESFAIFSA